MVKWVKRETKGKKPEFADTGPGEDTPGFVSLYAYQLLDCGHIGNKRGAHDTIDVGLNVFRGDFTVFFKDIPCFERQLIGENIVIPWP